MSGKKKRKTWSVQEKLRIVLAGVQGDIEISELCRREGLSPTQYYGWKKQLAASAGKIFGKQQKPSAETERLASDLSRAKDVIAEITAENLDLKKGLSG
jgi:transposase